MIFSTKKKANGWVFHLPSSNKVWMHVLVLNESPPSFTKLIHILPILKLGEKVFLRSKIKVFGWKNMKRLHYFLCPIKISFRLELIVLKNNFIWQDNRIHRFLTLYDKSSFYDEDYTSGYDILLHLLTSNDEDSY